MREALTIDDSGRLSAHFFELSAVLLVAVTCDDWLDMLRGLSTSKWINTSWAIAYLMKRGCRVVDRLLDECLLWVGA
jgi:hypothetical protein